MFIRGFLFFIAVLALVLPIAVKERMKYDGPLKNREIIIEFFPIGRLVKVTAMDTATLIEVSIQGPKSAGEEVLKLNGLKRLEYVLKKKGII